MLIIIFSMALASPEANAIPEISQDKPTIDAEYMIADFDLTQREAINLNLFIALSCNLNEAVMTDINLSGLSSEDIVACKPTDYFFFDARYLRVITDIFAQDTRNIKENERAGERLDTLGIFLFQQPFWSIHLALKMPTSLIEWMIFIKQKYTGNDRWPEIFGSENGDITNQAAFRDYTLKNSGKAIQINYLVPPAQEKLTPAGIMLSCRFSAKNDTDIKSIITEIMNLKIYISPDDPPLLIPLRRAYLVDGAENPRFSMEYGSSTDESSPTHGLWGRMDYDSLINRVQARESGAFWISDCLLTTKLAVNRFASYNLDAEPGSQYVILSETGNSNGYRKATREMSQRTIILTSLKIILIGLLTWTVLFLLFFRKISAGLKLQDKIFKSLLSYIAYMLVSALFSFMYGFGFVLGIIAVSSLISAFHKNQSILRLLLPAAQTAIFTAIIMLCISLTTIF